MRYTKPVKVFGIDENVPLPPLLRRKYQWSYEFDAYLYARRRPVDLVHVLYGEDYFRFSSYLFRKTPVIATFHQPAERLQQDARHGNLRGRVGGLTHLLTPDRYARLAAAIVMSSSQKKVLEEVMPAERIHVIPHGVALDTLQQQADAQQVPRVDTQILTVGQWMRDWDFYFRFIAYCREHRPRWRFLLVNRELPDVFRARVARHANLQFLDGVDDATLIQTYQASRVLFMPVLSAAGNNAVMESLALGCPVVMTEGTPETYYDPQVLRYHRQGDMDNLVNRLDEIVGLDADHFERLSARARQEAARFDWAAIGQQHLDLFADIVSRGDTASTPA